MNDKINDFESRNSEEQRIDEPIKEYYIREYLPEVGYYTPWSSPEGFAKLYDSKTFQNESFDFSFPSSKVQIIEFSNDKITNQWSSTQVFVNHDEMNALLNNALNKEKYLSFSDEEIQKAKKEYSKFETDCIKEDSYRYPTYQNYIAERFHVDYTFFVEHEKYLDYSGILYPKELEYPTELEYTQGFAPYNYSKEFAGVPQIYVPNSDNLDRHIVFTLNDGKKADDLDLIRASNVDMDDYKISHIMIGAIKEEITSQNGNTYKLDKGDIIFHLNDYGLHHAINVIDNNLESQSNYFMTENILGNENNRKALSKYFDEYDMRSTSDLIHRTFLSYEPVIRCYEDKDTLDFLYEGVKRYNDILDSEDNRERLQEPVTERYEELSRFIEEHPEFKDAEIVKLPFPEELKEEPEKEEQKGSFSIIKQLSKLKEKMEKTKEQPQDEKSKNKHNKIEI